MVAMRVLLLDADSLTAYRCHGGGVQRESRFARRDLASFAAYLKQNATGVYCLLADVADESFHLEHIPHVAGGARRALIARKLARHSRGTPLAAALAQGRLAAGRRDERVLFAALTRPQDVEPWLQALEQAQIALDGVYSMPQVLAGLAADRAAGCFLLMTLGGGGLRQTWVEDGRLRFSRLTTLAGDAIDTAATACADEAAQIHRYLCSQKLVERGVPLRVLVLAHAAQAERFRAHCQDSDGLYFEYLDLAAEAAQRGLAAPWPDSRGDALFVHLLFTKRPRQQFAPAASRRFFRLRQLRRALDGGSFAAFAAAVLFAAVQLPAVLRMQEHAQQLRAQAGEGSERDAQQAVSPDALRAQQRRELVSRYDQIQRASPSPAALFGRLSTVLDDVAEVELEHLDWRVSQEFDHAAGPFAIVDVHGALPPEIDRRSQLAAVERFVTRLRADPALQVQVLKLPIETASSQPLKSADAAQESAVFVLRVAQPL